MMQEQETFIPRTWALQKVASWTKEKDRCFIISGGPGTGKTKLSQQIECLNKYLSDQDSEENHKPFTLYSHFCKANDDTTQNPLRFIESLSKSIANANQLYAYSIQNIGTEKIVINSDVQIESQSGGETYGIYIKSISIGDISASLAYDQLIRRPLERMNTEITPYYILVDALDESLGFSEKNNLVDLLSSISKQPQTDKEWLRFILTSRPDPRVTNRLKAKPLDLSDHSESVNKDIERYIVANIQLKVLDENPTLLEKLVETSNGNFLYTQHIIEDINSGRIDIEGDTTPPLPTDLFDIYNQFLERSFEKTWPEIRGFFGLLAVARGIGLPKKEIRQILQISEPEIDDIIDRAQQYLRFDQESKSYHYYHQSFRDFLNPEFNDNSNLRLSPSKYKIYPVESHKKIINYYVNTYTSRWDFCESSYPLHFLVSHFKYALESDEINREEILDSLARLATDKSYHMMHFRRYGHHLEPIMQLRECAVLGTTSSMPAGFLRAVILALNYAIIKKKELSAELIFKTVESRGIETALEKIPLFAYLNAGWKRNIELSIALKGAKKEPEAAEKILQQVNANSRDHIAGLSAFLDSILYSRNGEPNLENHSNGPIGVVEDQIQLIIDRVGGILEGGHHSGLDLELERGNNEEYAEMFVIKDAPKLISFAVQNPEKGKKIFTRVSCNIRK